MRMQSASCPKSDQGIIDAGAEAFAKEFKQGEFALAKTYLFR